MGKIVVSQNMSLDGVVQDPTGEEGSEYGGWFAQLLDGDAGAWAEVELAEALRAEALLLGRRSDQYFGSRWNEREGEWADRLNSLPKYVVSSTLDTPEWVNGTIVRGDPVEQVAKLREDLAGEIVVYASRQLVASLLEHDLVDELRLIVFPTILGEGNGLFDSVGGQKRLRLIDARTVGSGLAMLTYERLR
jgi:dihydrofolate reductase